MIELKEFQKDFSQAVEKLEEKFPYASAFAQKLESKNITSSTREDNVSFPDPQTGFTLTIFNGENFIEYFSSNLSSEEINNGVKYLLSYEVKNKKDVIIDPGEKIEKDFSQEVKIDPASIDLSTYLDKAKENRSKIEKLSKLIQMTMFRLGYEKRDELFVNRNKKLFQRLCRFESLYFFILSDGKYSAEMFDGFAKIGGFEHASFDEEKVKKVVEDGIKVLGAPRLTPGTYTCIFSPAMAGMFAHEAFGHGTETDMFLKKRATGEEYIGKQVASKLVNMWDSPILGLKDNEACASFYFDHEGELANATQIIKDGILISGLTDLNSASRLKIKRTPNGRRESYSHKAYARMTNTYFENGKTPFNDMLKKVDYGFYIDHATNGMEDPKGWGIQLEALYAAEIKNGSFTGKVFSPVIVTGYVPDLLMSISDVGNDFKISSLGYCGKGHKEWVKVTDAGPHLLLKARLA
ncbi:MAG TPA: TldD/PmbA family protein [Exilispira sp.]|nr:TldD/PmbA family protein [Exilispira sp.]